MGEAPAGPPWTLVIPLGGLEDLGLNALALEAERDLVLIDCGLLFPPPDCPGTDYLIPDLAFPRERRE